MDGGIVVDHILTSYIFRVDGSVGFALSDESNVSQKIQSRLETRLEVPSPF